MYMLYLCLSIHRHAHDDAEFASVKRDNVIGWLSEHKPDGVLCLAQDTALPYMVLNGKSKG